MNVSSGTGLPGLSRTNGRYMVVVVVRMQRFAEYEFTLGLKTTVEWLLLLLLLLLLQISTGKHSNVNTQNDILETFILLPVSLLLCRPMYF